ncbi:gamma-secretase subunit Aph-1-like [Anneissia japonica]|uniref:gamma-secretase subunit Aph-1-like n=1 Tax=Anneissia japonica TaxID=1529436 RepID=UPI0014258476|nr:gamma-secretase subunit Aph-1-like [Anneissia japonica]
MTVMQFFGAMFIAYGPAIAMFLFTVVREPLRIIVMIAGMFFWLIALLVSSIWWAAVVPLKDDLAFALVFSVFFQEAFRYLYFRILRKAEDGLQQFNETDNRTRTPVGSNTPTTSEKTQHMYAYVSGFGFGVMSGLFSFSNILADSKGPGTVGLNNDPHEFLLTSAFMTMAFIFLHTFWNVIFFWGCEHRKYVAIGYVLATHLGVSLLTLFKSPILYSVVIPIVYVVLVVTTTIAFFVAGGSLKSLKSSVSISNAYKI